MDAFADFFPDLLVFAALLLGAIALTSAFEAAGLPGPAAFLAVGVAAGHFNAIPTDGLGELPLEEIGALALYGILFQGGVATGFRAWKSEARPILALGTIGTAERRAPRRFVSLASRGHSALVAVALSPTDPARSMSTFAAVTS